jgi:subtilisin family serine protease
MSEPSIVIKIGGKDVPLRKKDLEFNMLKPSIGVVGNIENLPEVVSARPIANDIFTFQVNEASNLDKIMEEARKQGVAHHVYEVDDEVPTLFIPTDRVNVKVAGDALPNLAENIAVKFNLIQQPNISKNIVSFKLTDATPMNPLKLSIALATEAHVEFAEPDFMLKISSLIPAASMLSFFDKQWHLRSVTGTHILPNSHINVEEAWEITKGSSDIVVAIFDDGFDTTNPDLMGNIVNPCDFTNAILPNNPADEIIPGDTDAIAEEQDFHGTPCAGLAIGRGQKSISGVAPNCSWMPVRTQFGYTSQDLTLKVFQYISKRADIVSCSWGAQVTPWSQPSQTAQEVLSELIETGGRRGKGLVICFAAGNTNSPLHIKASENSRGIECYDGQGTALGRFFKNKEVHSGWPEIKGIITVGAVTARNRKALYSNWGEQLMIVAPSDNFHPSGTSTRSKYNSVNLVTTQNKLHGRTLKKAGLSDNDIDYVTLDMGGTSGATPIVAGVCALMLSANPALTASEVVKLLQESADKDDLDFTLDEDEMFNNFGQNGHFNSLTGQSLWFGFGRVNAAKAVRSASELSHQ